MVAFTSCKEDATAKISAENVSQTEEREQAAANIDFPVMEFDKVEHDFGEIENGTPVLWILPIPDMAYSYQYRRKATGKSGDK